MTRALQRVLVAESDDSLRETLVDLLAASGRETVPAHSTNAMERALVEAFALGRRFDILVVDLALPGSCAFEMLERLGAAGLRPATVVLSTRTDDAILVDIYRIGCICVLAKPIDVRDLLFVVDRIVPTANQT